MTGDITVENGVLYVRTKNSLILQPIDLLRLIDRVYWLERQVERLEKDVNAKYGWKSMFKREYVGLLEDPPEEQPPDPMRWTGIDWAVGKDRQVKLMVIDKKRRT